DTPGNPARVVWHTTESPAGGNYFTSIAAYLIRVGAEPQVIYDPVTDKLGQFGPLNRSGRALRNDGSRRTNREGKVCIQVEVLGRAASPWT
ncbi:peptidoglycan-binding protein LysM, partial [Streptomyces sp. NRRL WC-3753]